MQVINFLLSYIPLTSSFLVDVQVVAQYFIVDLYIINERYIDIQSISSLLFNKQINNKPSFDIRAIT